MTAWAARGTGTAIPGRRFDSESYTYGYLFSKELFEEWEWQEHFAPQPEIERYLNHVVDRFDLRRHMRFGARVTSADYDEASGTWRVATGDGAERPGPVPGRRHRGAVGARTSPTSRAERTSGASRTTPARGRTTPVDFAGKRVAVIGTGSSGVQVVPAIADEVASLTVYQRTANWCTPLNNRPITDEEQAELRAGLRGDVRDAQHLAVTGSIHPANDRAAFDDPAEERQAFFETMWNSPGFIEADEQLHRHALQPRGQRRVVRVHRRKDPRPSSKTRRRPTG